MNFFGLVRLTYCCLWFLLSNTFPQNVSKREYRQGSCNEGYYVYTLRQGLAQ